jgi:hypothetical protein
LVRYSGGDVGMNQTVGRYDAGGAAEGPPDAAELACSSQIPLVA